MKGYIEEGAMVSCTFDIVGSPRTLQRAGERLVKYSSGKPLLTEQDKAVKVMFACKIPAKQWGGLLALIGGIAIGVALVLSGPVGWIALGALAVVVIGTVVAVAVHDCNAPLKAGKWIKYHDTVKIQNEKAILYNQSLLTCGKGGLLLASETPAVAQSVSGSMKWNTIAEVSVQILSQAIQGFFVGINAFDDIKSGDVGGDVFVIGTALGAYIYGDMYANLDKTESFWLGQILTGVSFGMGAMGIPGGSEDWSDLAWAEAGIAIELGSNFLEEHLEQRNSVLTKKKNMFDNLLPVEDQELEEGELNEVVTNNSSSGKKILSKKY